MVSGYRRANQTGEGALQLRGSRVSRTCSPSDGGGKVIPSQLRKPKPPTPPPGSSASSWLLSLGGLSLVRTDRDNFPLKQLLSSQEVRERTAGRSEWCYGDPGKTGWVRVQGLERTGCQNRLEDKQNTLAPLLELLTCEDQGGNRSVLQIWAISRHQHSGSLTATYSNSSILVGFGLEEGELDPGGS